MNTISPPPWRFGERGEIYDARRNRPIIYCAAWTQGSEADANGALVAAAPDLQAALRELVARIDRQFVSYTGGVFEPELTGARAALAKSEEKL